MGGGGGERHQRNRGKRLQSGPSLTYPLPATCVMCAVSVCAVCPWLALGRIG